MSEKNTVAWFKLADFVSRGEKERALNLYKLLMHSINDEALALQLAGDIFIAFNDQQAIEKYTSAGRMYKKQKRFLQAATVYEHVITLQESSLDVLIDLLEIYTTLQNQVKIIEITQQICIAYMPIDQESALAFGKKAVDCLSKTDTEQLHLFLSEVEKNDSEMYLGLSEYLER